MDRDGAFATLELGVGESRLSLVPQAGGAIAAWRVNGQSMLHESGVIAGRDWSPLDMASFPLVPYSNRIGGGAFSWGGVAHRLRANLPGHRHPLHGIGWQTAWEVADQATDSALLRHNYSGGADWPWAYSAEQQLILSDTGLVVDLAVINRSGTKAPLAIGMHPYFDSAGAQLTFAAQRLWQADSEQLPVDAKPLNAANDFSAGRRVADVALDNCFDGWDGHATIRWADRPLQLRMVSDLPCAVVYTPADAGFFCFEPVAHSNNALNLAGAGHAMPVVEPGQRITARVEFAVEEWG